MEERDQATSDLTAGAKTVTVEAGVVGTLTVRDHGVKTRMACRC